MPAFLLGLVLVHYSLRKWGWRITVCLACLLYLLGSVETYSSYLAESIFLTAFDSYKPSFSPAAMASSTHRFCPDRLLSSRQTQSPHFPIPTKTKLLVSTVILICEATIIYLNQGYDKNFIFSLIPFTAYLVAWTLTTDLFRQKNSNF